jgi:uncharacterized protein
MRSNWAERRDSVFDVRTAFQRSSFWRSRFARHASRITRHVLATLVIALPWHTAFALTPVPPLTSPVTDLTNTLTPSQVSSLEQTLLAFEQKKGSQIAVLMVPTTEPEAIEQYSIRVVDAWKLGRAKVDDGVLFLIAKNDRAMRIEVGKGLEGALPDVIAKRIIRDVVTPHFRTGDFYLGVVAGTDRIMSVVSGEPLPEPTIAERARKPTSDIGSILPVLLFAMIAITGVLRAIFGRFGGASLASVVVGFIVWMIVGTIVVAVIAAIIAFVIALVGGGGSGMSRRGGRYYGGGGFGGGWSGGSGGGFGGGWSGGGGGFGGGGASGRW